MSMRKLLESMARLDTAESKPAVSESAKPMSFLQSLVEFSHKNKPAMDLGAEYEKFKAVDEAMNPAVATASMKMAAPKVSAVATPSAPAAPNAPKAPGTPAAPAATAPASSAAKPNPNAPVQVEPEQPDMQIGSTQAKDLINTVAPIMQDPAGAQQLKTLADKFKLKPGVTK